MSDRKLLDSLANLERAVGKLEEALLEPTDRALVVEGTIKRFEIAIELLWKTLQRALDFEGIDASTPRETIRQAFTVGWVQDDIFWQNLIDSRNDTSHEYLADEIALEKYNDIVHATPTFRATLNFLKERYITIV